MCRIRLLAPALLTIPLVLLSLSSPAAENDPLDQALASMEDVLARLDSRDAPSAAALRQADMQLQIADRARALTHREAIAEARANAGSSDEASAEATGEAKNLDTAKAEDPRKLIDQLLDRSGLREGDNGPDHGQAFISRGQAVVTRQPGQRGYASARIIAYHQAELQARAAIARHLGSSISSERMLRLQDNDGDMDAILRSQDIDPDSLDAEARVQTVENLVRRRTGVQAAAALSGCTVFALAEGPGPGGAQEIHVALLWSPNLARLARFLQHGDPADLAQPLSPRPPLMEQLPRDEASLLRSMGVQPMIDEQGQRVLLAFGQAAIEPHSNPTVAGMRANQAYERAQLEASALLKEFVYEDTSSEAQQELWSLVETLSDAEGNEETVSQLMTSFRQEIRSGSEALELEGLRPLHRWRGRIDGHEVAGVVVMWSAAEQQRSRELRQEMSGEGLDAGKQKPHDNTPTRAGDGSGHGRVPEADSW